MDATRQPRVGRAHAMTLVLRPFCRCAPLAVGFLCLIAADAPAQTALSGPPLRIGRAAAAPITVDGAIGDDEWGSSERIEQWYETNPGDNSVPRVRSVGRIAYDDRFFYAAFEFDDPDPDAIRAPFSDRDTISGNATDFGGIILDTRNDGRSAVLLLVSARGVQYDAVTQDGTGEDSAPDFFWDSAARLTARGWTLEIRVPFSSLRYRNADPQTWGIMLYRNYPRDFRYQIFSMPLPRGGNCFVCRANTLVGLQNLPGGGHVVAAPYVSASQESRPVGPLGSRLEADAASARGGVDVKWSAGADNTVDFTARPDFSQIESDTAQITANERFALFFEEKRPFFLEGLQLLSTPVQAVYTRTITDPRWGSRLTGKARGISYTALVVDDKGGGSIVVPGPDDSSLADQDFGSYVFIGRARRDIGRSFLGVLVTDRESRDHQGYNRVIGPDFQWRPTSNDAVTWQGLFSATRQPTRSDLHPDWQGQSFTSFASDLEWSHNTTHLDFGLGYKDYGDEFRADTGFVPQVGYRETYHNGGWTVRPNGFVRRVRFFMDSEQQHDRSGDLIARSVNPGVEMGVRWNGSLEVTSINDRIRSGGATYSRHQVGYDVQFSPSTLVAQIRAEGTMGDEIDFGNSRPGRGATLNLSARLNVTEHLELALVQNERRLHVDDETGVSRRLFVARVSRVRGTYTFTSRTFTRVIGQYVSTDRDPGLYVSLVPPRSGSFAGSFLLAYKVNWQSVLFAGYGDDRELSDEHVLEPAGRQFFVKMSYAFQR